MKEIRTFALEDMVDFEFYENGNPFYVDDNGRIFLPFNVKGKDYIVIFVGDGVGTYIQWQNA